jgi:hypothetical protein
MSGELEALLRLVSEGRLTAEEAAPIVAALEGKSGVGAGPAGETHGSSPSTGRPSDGSRTRD